MPAGNALSSSSLRALWLGRQMRQLREQRGLTLKYVAGRLGLDYATVARHERAEELWDQERVAALLDLYGVYDGGEYERLLRLAEDAWRLPQWEGEFAAPNHDTSLVDMLWLESRAERIRCYDATVVPDLLQTAGYAAAVIRAGEEGRAAQQIERRVTERIERQQILGCDRPAELHVVLAEGVLHRPVGTPTVRVDQLRRLIEDGRASHIQICVLPTQAGYVPGMDAPFTVFELPNPYPLIACVRDLGELFLREASAAEPYATAFDRLSRAALSPDQSAELITVLASR